MELDLRRFFTPDAIVKTLDRLPELKTPIMDLLFSNTRNVPRPYVGVRDLGLAPGNIPVVRRGTHSIPMSSTDGSVGIIEPQPVNPSEFLSGADINNLRAMNDSSIQQEVDNIIDRLRRACRATAEAMAIQSLSGSINYYLREGSGNLVPYLIEYGTIGNASAAVAKKFDAAGAKISDVVKGIAAILDELKKKVDGNDVEIFAGFDVFSVLCDLAGAQANASIAQATANGISIGGGFTIRLMAATYKNLSTKSFISVVPAKNLLVVDKQAGHKMIYAGLDSIDAGQQALPFYAKPITSNDPSGVKVVAESKPLPVVNVAGIVKAQVLT